MQKALKDALEENERLKDRNAELEINLQVARGEARQALAALKDLQELYQLNPRALQPALPPVLQPVHPPILQHSIPLVPTQVVQLTIPPVL